MDVFVLETCGHCSCSGWSRYLVIKKVGFPQKRDWNSPLVRKRHEADSEPVFGGKGYYAVNAEDLVAEEAILLLLPLHH